MHASIFDLDHTLFTYNSSYQFAKYLFRKKILSFYDLICVIIYKCLFELRILSLTALHQLIFKRFFLGKSTFEIEKLAIEFVKSHFNQLIYHPAVHMLETAKEFGHYTVILSSSPDFLVKHITKQFEVDEWSATEYTIDQEGNFCSIRRIMEGEVKANYIHELAQKRGIPKDKITAYSDSYLDLPFLKAAGKAIAVNPDRTLRKICKKNNWETL